MWSHNNNDKNSPARGFWTPPASWRSQHSPAVAMMPMSERKERVSSPSCKRDIFHVIHKVPAGDSPYVRAKHVQVITFNGSFVVWINGFYGVFEEVLVLAGFEFSFNPCFICCFSWKILGFLKSISYLVVVKVHEFLWVLLRFLCFFFLFYVYLQIICLVEIERGD
jgi:hypothetical protein